MGLTRWWRDRILERERALVPPELWAELQEALPLLQGLSGEETRSLRDLSLLYLRGKALEEAGDIRLDRFMCLFLALQACLPVLHLGLEWYRGWYAVILYPEEFVPQREWVDEDGVVWVADQPMSGEAWEQGPVILSWSDVEGGVERDGYNLVLHEHAHKLDMRDGIANGHPPLHPGMSDADWAKTFGLAYHDMVRRVDGGEDTPIDPYATESPAEFFAVCTEVFFELPHLLQSEYPDIYAQLRGFYRQDPLRRLPPL
jgi:Mlc titration factor MtfA (ptsG expression regulator)